MCPNNGEKIRKLNKIIKIRIMKLIDSTPNLMVKNVKETIDFYTQFLGFEVIASVPETGDLVFAIVRSGNVMFMFQEENSLKEEYPQLAKFPQGGGLTFYTHVSDIHSLYEKLNGRVTIAKDLHQTFYGSTDFAIEDCNGYIITFSQEKV